MNIYQNNVGFYFQWQRISSNTSSFIVISVCYFSHVSNFLISCLRSLNTSVRLKRRLFTINTGNKILRLSLLSV